MNEAIRYEADEPCSPLVCIGVGLQGTIFGLAPLAGCGRKGFRGDVRAAGMTAMSLSDALPGGLTACGGARPQGL